MAAIIPLRGGGLSGVPVGLYSTGTAGAAIGGHRIVKKDSSSLLQYASSAILLDTGKVLGLSVGAASIGSSVSVLMEGEIEEPSWNWTLDLPIFLSIDGLLTQTVPSLPTNKFSQIVAFPITATRILLNLREPLVLTS